MNQFKIKISVVIPSHNNEPWIKECVDSLNRQQVDSMESIFVLDNNADHSEKLINKYAKNFSVFKTNFKNAAKARNFGVLQAKGKWVAFLDGDDYWMENHLSDGLLSLEKSSQVAYFGHFNEFHEEKGEFFEQSPAAGFSSLSEFTGEEFYQLFLAQNPGWPTSGMIVDRNRFLEVGGFDEQQIRRHDTEMFSRLVYGQKWTYNPAIGFIYRKDVPGAISSDRASCSYFRLLADIKICKLYGLDEGKDHLRRRAEIALSDQYLLSRDTQHQMKTLRLALPFLKGKKLMFYRAVGWHPFLCRSILAFFGRVRCLNI